MRRCPSAGNIYTEIWRAAIFRLQSRKNATFADKSNATIVNQKIDCTWQVGVFEYLAFALNKSETGIHWQRKANPAWPRCDFLRSMLGWCTPALRQTSNRSDPGRHRATFRSSAPADGRLTCSQELSRLWNVNQSTLRQAMELFSTWARTTAGLHKEEEAYKRDDSHKKWHWIQFWSCFSR